MNNSENKKTKSENFESQNQLSLKNVGEPFMKFSSNLSDSTETNNKNVIDELMEELKIKGDLSLYIGLSFAKIVETNRDIVITFPPDKKIQSEIVKSKLDHLEKLYLNKAGIKKEFIVKIENENEDAILTKLKTLFGNNFTIEE